MVTISGESDEILLLLKELVSKVKTLEDAVYNKDNILMKSGFVVVDTPTPAIRNEHTVNDISKMDWSQIHETVNKMGWIDMPEKVTKEERVAEIAIEHAKKLLEVVKAKKEDSIVDAEVGERLNMKTIFLLTGMGKDYINQVKSTCNVDLISKDLLEAAKDIKLILE